MNLEQVLCGARPAELADVPAYLDGLDGPGRTRAIRSLSARALSVLFDAALGYRALTLEHFVPSDVPPRTEVVHKGQNSLPTFRRFAKLFCRPHQGATELWGYNAAGPLVGGVAGPGYFVAKVATAGEVLIDYTRVPSETLPGWPPLKRNEAGLSRFVYGGMRDVMRGVSAHVSVGRAIRGGKVANNWFALCRLDP